MPKRPDKSWKSKLESAPIPPELEEWVGNQLDASDKDDLVDSVQAPLKDMVINSEAEELADLLRRMVSSETETLNVYRPMAAQKAFHQSRAYIRLLISGNRGGKTTPAAIEVGRAVLDRDPHKKFPKTGSIYCVGYDFDHVGEVMWNKLGGFGAMRILYDERQGKWRAVRPNSLWDAKHKHLWRYAAPIIPPHMVAPGGYTWEEKSKLIPRKVRLVTGWTINFYSSKAEQPPRGFDTDAVWFDEEILGPKWFDEVALRGTIDREGRFWWSATAQNGTAKMAELVERAEDPEDKDVERFQSHIKDNPFVPAEAKRRFFEGLSPEERRVRWDGELAIHAQVVYPEFNEADHVVQAFPIPAHWSIYVYIDPGFQRSAALFVAVPPPQEDPHIYFFDEIYQRRSVLPRFCETILNKLNGRIPESFTIDHRMGRQTQQTTGLTVEEQYIREFRRIRLKSRRTGHAFRWGNADIAARTTALQQWMVPNAHGVIRFKAMRGKVDNMLWELPKQLYAIDPKTKEVTDKRIDRNNHLMTCAEYCASENPRYSKPVEQKSGLKTAREKMEYLDRRYGGGNQNQQTVISMGPRGAKRDE